MGSMPVPPNTDFDFDIRPLGVENAYKFTIGYDADDKDNISVVIMAGSGIAKIFKKNTKDFYGE